MLGSFNNLAEIGRISHKYGAQLLVDAAQLVAHSPVNMAKCGIDFLAFSGHKVYTPFGCGALVVIKGLLRFSTVEMEFINSSCKENAGGIAVLGKALVLLHRIGMEVIREEEKKLTGKVLHGLAQIAKIQTFGITDLISSKFAKRSGVIVFSQKGKVSDGVTKKLAEQGGIGVRWGCQCTHILEKHILGVGPKLELFQRIIVTLFPRLRLPGVVRVGLGMGNSEEEIETLIRVL